ncbi:hypothetical protein D3C84_696450 [compost metagenome]
MHLRRVDGRLVTLGGGLELVDQRLLLVVGLLRYAVIDAQQFVALEIDLGHRQLRLALAELGPGLVEAGADRTIVDGRQQVTLLDQLPFLDQQPGEDAVDLRPDDHAVQRQDRADAAGEARYILLHHADGPYRNGSRSAGLGGHGLEHKPEDEGHQGDQQHDEQDGFLLGVHGYEGPVRDTGV